MDLCVACGMCCTGELFSSVDVTLEEAPRLASRRLPLHDDGARSSRPGEGLLTLAVTPPRGDATEAGATCKLPQPCAAHDGRCTIYEDRPAACASFRCATLVAAEAGEVSFAEALATLTRAKTLAASVRARVPGSGALWRDVEAAIQPSPEWRRANAELLLDIAVVRERLRRIRHG